MSQLLTGSICLTELLEKAKQGHSAFSKAGNGKIYFNFAQWINEEPDKFGNISSLQLQSKKDVREAEGKCYIGNAKKYEPKDPQPVTPSDIPEVDDLPF